MMLPGTYTLTGMRPFHTSHNFQIEGMQVGTADYSNAGMQVGAADYSNARLQKTLKPATALIP